MVPSIRKKVRRSSDKSSRITSVKGLSSIGLHPQRTLEDYWHQGGVSPADSCSSAASNNVAVSAVSTSLRSHIYIDLTEPDETDSTSTLQRPLLQHHKLDEYANQRDNFEKEALQSHCLSEPQQETIGDVVSIQSSDTLTPYGFHSPANPQSPMHPQMRLPPSENLLQLNIASQVTFFDNGSTQATSTENACFSLGAVDTSPDVSTPLSYATIENVSPEVASAQNSHGESSTADPRAIESIIASQDPLTNEEGLKGFSPIVVSTRCAATTSVQQNRYKFNAFKNETQVKVSQVDLKSSQYTAKKVSSGEGQQSPRTPNVAEPSGNAAIALPRECSPSAGMPILHDHSVIQRLEESQGSATNLIVFGDNLYAAPIPNAVTSTVAVELITAASSGMQGFDASKMDAARNIKTPKHEAEILQDEPACELVKATIKETKATPFSRVKQTVASKKKRLLGTYASAASEAVTTGYSTTLKYQRLQDIEDYAPSPAYNECGMPTVGMALHSARGTMQVDDVASSLECSDDHSDSMGKQRVNAVCLNSASSKWLQSEETLESNSALLPKDLHNDSRTDVPAPCYYLDAFEVAIQFALKENDTIWTDTEIQCLLSFFQLNRDTRKLYVRLYNRSSKRFIRFLRLDYVDITDMKEHLYALEQFGALSVLEGTHIEKILHKNIPLHRKTNANRGAVTQSTIMYTPPAELPHVAQEGPAQSEESDSTTGLLKRLESLQPISTEIYDCMTLKEIKKLIADTPIPNKSVFRYLKTRASIISELGNVSTVYTTLTCRNTDRTLLKGAFQIMGPLIELEGSFKVLIKKVLFLFYIASGENGTVAMLSFLNKVDFPSYTIPERKPIFKSRELFDQYFNARQLEDKTEMLMAQGGKSKEIIRSLFTHAEAQIRNFVDNKDLHQWIDKKFHHPFLRKLTAEWVYASILWKSIALLKSWKAYQSAVDTLILLLQSHINIERRGRFYNELTLILFKHLNNSDLALFYGIECFKEASLISKGLQLEIAKRMQSICRCLNKSMKSAKSKKWYTLLPVEVSLAVLNWVNFESENAVKETKMFGRPLDATKQTGSSSMFLGLDDSFIRVEELALEAYKDTDEWRGMHCEGSLFCTLFGILMYDCLFLSVVEDVFFTPFQDAPLDLLTNAFYLNRQKKIDMKLNELQCILKRDLYRLTKQCAKQTYGQCIRGVVWSVLRFFNRSKDARQASNKEMQCKDRMLHFMSVFTNMGEDNLSHDSGSSTVTEPPNYTNFETAEFYSEFIGWVAASIGGPVLSAAFKLLCENYVYWQGGLPDLFLWKKNEAISSLRNSDSCTSEEARYGSIDCLFAEVKGPRDRLSEKQRLWLIEIQKAGGKVEICRMIDPSEKEKNAISISVLK